MPTTRTNGQPEKILWRENNGCNMDVWRIVEVVGVFYDSSLNCEEWALLTTCQDLSTIWSQFYGFFLPFLLCEKAVTNAWTLSSLDFVKFTLILIIVTKILKHTITHFIKNTDERNQNRTVLMTLLKVRQMREPPTKYVRDSRWYPINKRDKWPTNNG